jgi:hypothetical protein
LTAAITRRPSPEPRSTTKSLGPTRASLSISTTTASGVAAIGRDALRFLVALRAGVERREEREAGECVAQAHRVRA